MRPRRDRLARRAGRVAKLAHRLRRRIEHLLARHPQMVAGDQGLERRTIRAIASIAAATGQTIPWVSRINGGRRPAASATKRQQVAQIEVLAAQDVFLARGVRARAPADALRPRHRHARRSARYRDRPASVPPPRRAIIRPVGVGLMSRGPTGAAGLTITTGSALRARASSAACSAMVFRPLVDADDRVLGHRRRLIPRRAVVGSPRAATELQ